MIHRSFILETLVDIIVRTALVFSLFLLFSGHNAPGGGFVAGLVCAIALILKYIANGRSGVEAVLRVSADALLASGLSLALLTAVFGWMWGDAFLETTYVQVEVPVLGTVKMTSALPFDIGVFAVVVGLVATLIMSFGEDEPA